LKPKIRLEEIKEFKIESKVFDRRTLLTMLKLMDKGIIKSIESTVKEGKESLILSAKNKENNWLAIKVYKTLHCDFKSRWGLLTLDPRFKGLKKERRSVVNNWCKREFKNLKIAFANNVTCPKPIAFKENVLIMSFIGENGEPAPRLIDIEIENMQDVYSFIVDGMKKLAKAGLIHSDLSAYNILIHDVPYFIDFSQAVMKDHPLAKEFLDRDVKNINSYFKKAGVKTQENLFDELIKIMELR
jgi:RIO kinase 1